MSNLVFSKTQKLKDEIIYLKANKDRFLKDMSISGDVRRIVERSVFLCAEIFLDLTDLILTEKNLPKPESYSDSIYKLGEHGIIPGEFAYKIIYLAGLRNFLAHDYQKDTVSKLSEFLNSGIGDLEKFIEHIGY